MDQVFCYSQILMVLTDVGGLQSASLVAISLHFHCHVMELRQDILVSFHNVIHLQYLKTFKIIFMELGFQINTNL